MSSKRLNGGKQVSRKVSEKQLVANRRNAKSSTGPKSKKGKQVVSNNAAKHQIFQKISFEISNNPEESINCKNILDGLIEDWEPQGQTQELIVQKLAINYIRLQRVLRYESAKIQEEMEQYSASKNNSLNEDLEWERRVISDLRNIDDDPAATFACLLELKNNCGERKVSDKLNFVEEIKNWEASSAEEKEKWRQGIFTLADEFSSQMEEKLKLQEKQNRLSCINSFLADGDIAKILKYEGYLERSISKLIDQLIILQRIGPK